MTNTQNTLQNNQNQKLINKCKSSLEVIEESFQNILDMFCIDLLYSKELYQYAMQLYRRIIYITRKMIIVLPTEEEKICAKTHFSKICDNASWYDVKIEGLEDLII